MIKDIDAFPAKVKALIKHYNLERLPVEGTLFANVYKSTQKTPEGNPCGTAMVGLYCKTPLSASCFHRLTSDEVWHFYGGDPLNLYLLNTDGSHKTIVMGSDLLNGQKTTYVVPAGVWQAGEVAKDGVYALFGCTMAPGFYEAGFEAAIGTALAKQFPYLKDIITRLSVNGMQTAMPTLDN